MARWIPADRPFVANLDDVPDLVRIVSLMAAWLPRGSSADVNGLTELHSENDFVLPANLRVDGHTAITVPEVVEQITLRELGGSRSVDLV